ncbi:hypothetical protein LTR36_006539, partial [Oleoguttula mirabilis]
TAQTTAADSKLDSTETEHDEEWVHVSHGDIRQYEAAEQRAELRRKLGIDRERMGEYVVL